MTGAGGVSAAAALACSCTESRTTLGSTASSGLATVGASIFSAAEVGGVNCSVKASVGVFAEVDGIAGWAGAVGV